MKKIITSTSMLLLVSAIVIGSSIAYFSDTERSDGNTFSAGEIDLGIDNSSYYNGVFNPDTSWLMTYDLSDGSGPSTDGKYLFFDFDDLKPGDWGEDTISIHVKDNDAWACLNIDLSAIDDNGLTEPEEEDGDTTGGVGEGELQKQIKFMWWKDDGDNVLEEDEANSVFYADLLAGLAGIEVPLADSTGNGVLSDTPLLGSETYYIGKAWCFGSFDLVPVEQDGFGPIIGADDYPTNGPDVRSAGVYCDGIETDNTTQSDSVVGDISFIAVQSRNNPDFKCEGGIGCLEKADVMLVLDRSSSISSSEMDTLKDAANAFVEALAPSPDGIHVGLVSFASNASLDVHLTSDAATVTSTINSLVSGGMTNTSEAIDFADTELGDPTYDRPDVDSPDIIVLITDGEPTVGGGKPIAEAAADAAKANGIEIFGVGVGITPTNALWMEEEIVSPPGSSHYFDATDFNALAAILEALANCDQP